MFFFIVLAPDNSLAPQRFNSPTFFKGYPKAMERKSTGKGRRKGSSLISTDTPVKDALEKFREKSKYKAQAVKEEPCSRIGTRF